MAIFNSYVGLPEAKSMLPKQWVWEHNLSRPAWPSWSEDSRRGRGEEVRHSRSISGGFVGGTSWGNHGQTDGGDIL